MNKQTKPKPNKKNKKQQTEKPFSSKYLFFRQIFAGPGALEKMLCPCQERVAGK